MYKVLATMPSTHDNLFMILFLKEKLGFWIYSLQMKIQIYSLNTISIYSFLPSSFPSRGMAEMYRVILWLIWYAYMEFLVQKLKYWLLGQKLSFLVYLGGLRCNLKRRYWCFVRTNCKYKNSVLATLNEQVFSTGPK